MAQEEQSRIEREETKVPEFMDISGSPIRGITMRHVFQGHKGRIGRMAWSPNGLFLASPSEDGTIRIWNIESPENSYVLIESKSEEQSISWIPDVYCLAWSPDGKILASGSSDNVVRLWDIEIGTLIRYCKGHTDTITSANWSPNGKFLASASDDQTIIVWDVTTGKEVCRLNGHNDWVTSVVWSVNGDLLISGCGDSFVRIWNFQEGKIIETLSGHFGRVTNVALTPDGQHIVSTSTDATIRFWNLESGVQIRILEDHALTVRSISFLFDGRIMASNSWDSTVRLWRCDTWERIAINREAVSDNWAASLAFHPKNPILATLGHNNTIIRIWDLDVDLLLTGEIPTDSISYTTAKIVLVGDSGVGKTGLGWRLAHNEFKEHSSTHGQQFWVIPELGLKREDGTECEAVLWDLAGQPDYRLVHSLFLDDVDTALVLFDPTNRQEPLSGVDFWLNQLKQGNKDLCNTILVGARTDRGTSTLTKDELIAYCESKGICGGYIPTSAKEGVGLEELLETLKEQIPWEEMTATVTTVTFKRIKDFVLDLKEQVDRKNVLVSPVELREMLQASQTSEVSKTSEVSDDWQFSDAEMMTAVGHLANHGYVTILLGSKGEESILLAPDLLANLASSIVLEARRNPRGLGALEENRLLAGEYDFPELRNLEEDERDILLDAAVVLFLEKHLCFREIVNQQVVLVFPSLINEKRPKDENIDPVEGASYRIKGAVENVYASLVVLLGYTTAFIRTNQWQNQAQYVLGEDEICGFQQSDYRAGEIELVLYYDEKTPEPTKLLFRGMFERFLSRHDLEIGRYQAVFCENCGNQLARNVVLSQFAKGKDFSFCNECGERLSLPSPEPLTRLSRREEVELDVQQGIAQRRTAFEAALVRVKALLRDRGKEKSPTCFISYAWGIPEHERWVLQMAKDLRNAGIDVLLDRWHSPPGSNLDLFIERIISSDFVIPVGTPKLREKYDARETDPVVAAELKLINLRIRQPTEYGDTVLPVLLDGTAKDSLTPQLQTLVNVDFRESVFYFRKLFDMIWRLYELPFDNPLLEELQASMSPGER